jgi:hypothetical protein
MDAAPTPGLPETFNPWSIVNLVFHHLAAQGLHPVLGEAGDPGAPAADLLRALGITPAAEGNRQASEQTRQNLAAIRAAFDPDGLSRERLARTGLAPVRATAAWLRREPSRRLRITLDKEGTVSF